MLAHKLLKQLNRKNNARSLAEIVEPHCTEIALFHEDGALVCVYRLTDDSAIKSIMANTQQEVQK